MSQNSWRPNRRDFLKAGVATSALLCYPAYAQKSPPVPLEHYQAVYFSAIEWTFVMAACARLIPSDGEGPGALETRVPVFIDLQLAGDYGKATDWYMEGPHEPSAEHARGFQSPLNPAQIYRQAISYINDWCQKTHGKVFAELSHDVQDQVLTACQKNEIGLSHETKEFFSILLQNTKEGYFADPQYGGNYGMASWSYIGFPGARASYKEWVDQHNIPHPLGPVPISGERA